MDVLFEAKVSARNWLRVEADEFRSENMTVTSTGEGEKVVEVVEEREIGSGRREGEKVGV